MKLPLGLAFLEFASAAFAQYAGPAILSRGEAPAAMAAAQIDFRPFAEVMGLYDTGIAGIVLTSQGTLSNSDSTGLVIGWGVSGTHSWRHTKVGLDYHGTLSHYTQQSYYDTTDQALLLSVNHQFTRHSLLTLRESVGTFTRNFTIPGLVQTVAFDPISSNIPTTDFFDNRVIYLSTQADFTLQKSARLSFNFGGQGFIVRRRSTALDGVVGAGAQGDVQYRLSARTTIGSSYQYLHYDFTRVLGGTDSQVVDGTYSVRLSRNMEFSGYAGVMRVESKFVQLVPVDPVIAALLGITAAPQLFHTIARRPNLGGRISRKYAKGVLYASGGHTVTPGNGLFLTSYSTSAVAGYTYTGLRRWSFSTSFAYDRSEAIGPINGTYGDVASRSSVSRQIRRVAHAVWQVNMTHYNSPSYSTYNRWIYDIRAGLGFTPGDIPLRIW